MPNLNENYASYLLRLWSVRRGEDHTWVASVQCTATGELHRFPNLDTLLQFLQDEFGECARVKDARQLAVQETEPTVLTEPRSPGSGKPGDGLGSGNNPKGGVCR